MVAQGLLLGNAIFGALNQPDKCGFGIEGEIVDNLGDLAKP